MSTISSRFPSVRGESHIDFCTQCVIIKLAGRGAVPNDARVCVCVCRGGGGVAIINDALKFRKVIEFESSCIVCSGELSELFTLL